MYILLVLKIVNFKQKLAWMYRWLIVWTHRRSQDFLWGCTFFLEKVDDLSIVAALRFSFIELVARKLKVRKIKNQIKTQAKTTN